MRRKLAAGNWKMNGTADDLSQIIAIAGAATAEGPQTLICPPATLLTRAADAARGTELYIGAQDCHAAERGAHTGDISAMMLRDAGATHVILGHSERRADHGEGNALVHTKAETAWGANLVAVICVGETEAQRDAGDTLSVIADQMAGSVPGAANDENTVIAYEPVWAIGTGRVPTLDQIAEVHGAIRAGLVARFGEDTGHAFRLLYGGSVKPSNAGEIFGVSDVDGALVGGASLKAADFTAIMEALAQA